MATIHISGPYLRHYPDIWAELKRLHIERDVRYVEMVTQEFAFKNRAGEAFGKMEFIDTTSPDFARNFKGINYEKPPPVVAVLHTDNQVPLAINGIAHYYSDPTTPHNGSLGDGKVVRYKKRVWYEMQETSVPGIRLNSRNLTASQALELLEWLEQEREVLEMKAREEGEAKLG